jgi:hypothetical protein
MVSPIKKFTMVFVCMGVSAASVLWIYSLYNIPDEIAGILYFITIGIAASGVLNYYRKKEISSK